MLGLVALTMAIIYLTPKLTKAVPATLVGILAVALLAHFLRIETKTVGDLGSIAGGLPGFHVPDVPFDLETLRIVFPYSLVLAGVGLIETLLTLTLIDEITDTRGQPNRESLAQGAANIVTGAVRRHGRLRDDRPEHDQHRQRRPRPPVGHRGLAVPAVVHPVRRSVIEQIPLAALIGVMFVVCEKTFEWGTFRLFGKVPRADALVVVLVAGVTLAFNLATAVVAGVIVSALVFAWQHAQADPRVDGVDAAGWKVYELEGTLFFASVAGFPGAVRAEGRSAGRGGRVPARARGRPFGDPGDRQRWRERYRSARQAPAPAPPEPGLPRAAGACERHDRGEPAGRPALPRGRRQAGLRVSARGWRTQSM